MLINIVTLAMTKTKTKRESQREIKPVIVREQKCELPITAAETSSELPNTQVHRSRRLDSDQRKIKAEARLVI
jgi:hypothetical protein